MVAGGMKLDSFAVSAAKEEKNKLCYIGNIKLRLGTGEIESEI